MQIAHLISVLLVHELVHLARICLTEASTSLPFMKIVTLRVLDFAITDVLAKMVQTSVTGWDESLALNFGEHYTVIS